MFSPKLYVSCHLSCIKIKFSDIFRAQNLQFTHESVRTKLTPKSNNIPNLEHPGQSTREGCEAISSKIDHAVLDFNFVKKTRLFSCMLSLRRCLRRCACMCAHVWTCSCARTHQSDVGSRVCARVCLCVWYGGGSDPEEGFSTLRARSWGDVLVGGRPRGRCGVATKTERWPLKTTRTHMEDVLLGNRRESHMVGPPTPGSGSAHLHRGSSQLPTDQGGITA